MGVIREIWHRTMQEQEEDLVVKQKLLYSKMRSFDPVDINQSTIAIVDDKMKIFDDAVRDFIEGIEILLISHSDALGTDRVAQWKTVQSTTEKDSIEYRKKVYRKAYDVKETLNQTFPTSAPMHAQSQMTSSMMFQNEQLKVMKRHNEILEKEEKENERQERLNETVKENESKRAAAEAKAKNKLDAIHTDCDELAEKIGSLSLEDWKLQPDLAIGRAMKEIKTWEESLGKIVALKRHLDDIMAKGGLSQDDIEYLEVKNAVERTTQDVKFVAEAVRGEDDKRELYTLDPAKTDAIKIPTFEGRDDEDFAKFKEDVEKAFVTNRVCRSDKLDKLREALKGHAKKLVPQSITNNIDEAWEILGKAFGDPIRLKKEEEIDFKIGIIFEKSLHTRDTNPTNMESLDEDINDLSHRVETKIRSYDESSDFYFPSELETTPRKQELKREKPSDTDNTVQVSFDDEYKSEDLTSNDLDASNGCECKICGKIFLQKENLKKHLIVHSDDKPFACTECEFKTERKDKLNSHMKFKHTPSSAESVSSPECGKEFRQRHLPIHNDERPFPCVECESRFKRKDTLKDHVNAKHNDDNEMEDKKAFKCTVSNKGYGSSWYQMNTVEMVIDALKKDDEAVNMHVSRVDNDGIGFTGSPSHGEGVQHRNIAKIAKKKMNKHCVLHCRITEHGPTAIPVVVNNDSFDKEHFFENMPDRSWHGLEEYEEEMCSLANKDNTPKSLMCSVNLDLNDVMVEDL